MLSPAAARPACPTPAEEIAAALDRIGPLHGLPLEDRLWLAATVRKSWPMRAMCCLKKALRPTG